MKSQLSTSADLNARDRIIARSTQAYECSPQENTLLLEFDAPKFKDKVKYYFNLQINGEILKDRDFWLNSG